MEIMSFTHPWKKWSKNATDSSFSQSISTLPSPSLSTPFNMAANTGDAAHRADFGILNLLIITLSSTGRSSVYKQAFSIFSSDSKTDANFASQSLTIGGQHENVRSSLWSTNRVSTPKFIRYKLYRITYTDIYNLG